jgi:hypothetical protein
VATSDTDRELMAEAKCSAAHPRLVLVVSEAPMLTSIVAHSTWLWCGSPKLQWNIVSVRSLGRLKGVLPNHVGGSSRWKTKYKGKPGLGAKHEGKPGLGAKPRERVRIKLEFGL